MSTQQQDGFPAILGMTEEDMITGKISRSVSALPSEKRVRQFREGEDDLDYVYLVPTSSNIAAGTIELTHYTDMITGRVVPIPFYEPRELKDGMPINPKTQSYTDKQWETMQKSTAPLRTGILSIGGRDGTEQALHCKNDKYLIEFYTNHPWNFDYKHNGQRVGFYAKKYHIFDPKKAEETNDKQARIMGDCMEHVTAFQKAPAVRLIGCMLGTKNFLADKEVNVFSGNMRFAQDKPMVDESGTLGYDELVYSNKNFVGDVMLKWFMEKGTMKQNERDGYYFDRGDGNTENLRKGFGTLLAHLENNAQTKADMVMASGFNEEAAHMIIAHLSTTPEEAVAIKTKGFQKKKELVPA